MKPETNFPLGIICPQRPPGCSNLAARLLQPGYNHFLQPCCKVAQTMELKLWRDGNNLVARLLQGCRLWN